ncbi:hypothetical protein AB205_0166740, partial [Aquarana catesbeiana]
IHIGEKRIGTSEDTRDPPPPKQGEIHTPQPQDVEEGEVYKVGEIVTTTGDVNVVEEETHFTSASAHVIGEIMVCNRDLQKIKEDINDVGKKDSKTSEYKTPTFVKFFFFFLITFLQNVESQILKMHTVCQHVLSAIMGYQCTRFVGATPSSQLK